ncbi:hypothetical protein [Wolbachia endosymbiont of Nilaparvata lugens]|uniref:hypothetical protein n=1 Tax=Wolbachia endosymbiont of Nilaparvata lugens TaxID=357143 RepID=UPI001180DADF|nr:hypothetical protein [Wolbachia endosymbiont of Nilaparvata lugens]
MPGSENKDNVTLVSHTTVSENSGATPPTPTPRTSTPKQDGKNTDPFEEAASNKPSSILPANQASQLDEIAPTLPPRNSDSQLNIPQSPNRLEESSYAELNLPTSNGSADSRPEEPAYAVINKSKKTPEDSSKADNETNSQHPTLSRSPSQETVFDQPWDRDESEKNLLEKFSQHSDTPSTSPPSYTSRSSSQESSPTNSKSKLQKNRFWPKAQYAMQQKGVVIFGAAAIVLSTSTALVYLQDKAKFITFFTNSPLYTVVPIIAVASLLVISPIFFATKQFINTKEYQAQGKNADEVLDNVFRHQPEGKVIKSVRLEYSNGTHSNFVLNAWKSKKGFVNIDEKVISKTNKMESLINNRPLFTTLLTAVVAANISLPLLLYMEGGVNNIQKFYQNPLINNIRLLPLTGLVIVALLAVCVGVHYYRKTNCTNLVYSEETIDPKNVNGKFIEEIKRERTNVLGENHSKDAKRSSLTLEQVVVQSHNCKDAIYSISE